MMEDFRFCDDLFEMKKTKEFKSHSKLVDGSSDFSIHNFLWFNSNDYLTTYSSEVPPNYMSLKYKADYLYFLRNYDLAKEIYESLINMNVPDLLNRSCLIDKINCHIHLLEFPEAQNHIFSLIQTCNNHDQVIEALMLLKNLFYKSQDLSSHILTLKKLVLIVEDVAENWIFLAECYEQFKYKTIQNKDSVIVTNQSNLKINNPFESTPTDQRPIEDCALNFFGCDFGSSNKSLNINENCFFPSISNELDLIMDDDLYIVNECKSWICYEISLLLLNKFAKSDSSFTNEIIQSQISKVREKLNSFNKYSHLRSQLMEDLSKNKILNKGVESAHSIILKNTDEEIETVFDLKYFSFIKNIKL